MNVKELLYQELLKAGLPVYQQGSMSIDEAYPNEFITFWLNSADDVSHYENSPKSYEWDFTVILYSNDPKTVYSKAEGVRNILKSAGFIPQGKPIDTPSDEPTHTGLALDYLYLEYEKEA